MKQIIYKNEEIDWAKEPYFWIHGNHFKTRNEAIKYIKENHIELECFVCKKKCTPDDIDFIFPPIPEYMCKNCPDWANWVSGVACCLGLLINVLKEKKNNILRESKSTLNDWNPLLRKRLNHRGAQYERFNGSRNDDRSSQLRVGHA